MSVTAKAGLGASASGASVWIWWLVERILWCGWRWRIRRCLLGGWRVLSLGWVRGLLLVIVLRWVAVGRWGLAATNSAAPDQQVDQVRGATDDE